MHPPQGYSPELVPETSLIGRIQEKLAASRFFTYSLLFHVILLALAGGIVVVTKLLPDEDFQAISIPGTGDETHLVEPVDPRPVEVITPKLPVPAQPETAKLLETVIVSSRQDNIFVAAPPALPALKLGSDAAPAPPVPTSGPFSGPAGPGNNVPAQMAGRFGGTKRDTIAKNAGMKPKAEQAVVKGLRWLKEHQNEDGSWSAQFSPSMTGLAVLSFLGHGELPESQEFGPTVKKGVDWIINNGTKFGGRLSMTPTLTQTGVYEHAIATYALGEYYTMTKDDRAKDVLTQAVGHIVDGQAPDGGWQYAFAKGPDSDTSVSGWQIQALKAAHLSGLNLPGVDECLDKAMLNLRRVNGPKGGFGYRTAQDSYSLTGAGVLCTYFWKGEKDKVVRDGIKFIIDETEKQYPIVYKSEKANLYAWYYHTQACLMFGGSAWTKWNKWFQDEVTDNQGSDGAWPAIPAKAAGPQSADGGAGPYYRTTLCVLMLEVYYRYMPTNGGGVPRIKID